MVFTARPVITTMIVHFATIAIVISRMTALTIGTTRRMFNHRHDRCIGGLVPYLDASSGVNSLRGIRSVPPNSWSVQGAAEGPKEITFDPAV